MADNLTPFDSSTAPAPAAPAQQGGVRGFLSSKAGKIIIGVALLVVVGAVVGVIAVSFLGVQAGSDSTNIVVTQPKPTPVAEGSTETTPVEAPEDVDLEDVFTYRDVFVPTVTLTSTTTSTTTSTSSTSSSSSTSQSSNTPSNTLVLEDIATENGEQVAVLGWNGQTYTLAEGESIPGTPWQVLTINSSSVVMLYGDQRITLSVGVGISK